MMAWTTSTPAAISSSHPKNSMETTVAATARPIATNPSSTKPTPKARNQPQLRMISAGIRTSRDWISLMARLLLQRCDVSLFRAPSSFDHFVGAGEQRCGYLQAKRLRGLEVEQDLVLGRRLQ